MMCRLITALIFIMSLACFVPAGCRNNAENKIAIGFLVKQPEELWFQNEWKFAQRCAEKYGFDLIKIGATDGEKVLSAIDNLAARGAKGFVICPPDVRLGPAIMAKARSYDMKVYTVDDQFVGADGKLMDVPYMGISSREIGRTVGEALWAEFTKRGWSLDETGVCAITYDELNTVKERTDGAADALIAAGFPADKIYRCAQKAIGIPGAMDSANIVLTQHAEVKRWLIFSVNDEGVLGSVRAMENRGFTADSIIGVGIGAGSSLVEFSKPKSTGFFATCLISPKRHGFETAEYLYKWITEGTPPPNDIKTAGILVTRETYKQVMKDQGLLD